MTSINVRTSDEFREKIDTAASARAMDRSAWVLMACENELRRHEPRGRQIQVRDRKTAGRIAQNICPHPPELRSEPVDGTSRCMACNAEIRRLP